MQPPLDSPDPVDAPKAYQDLLIGLVGMVLDQLLARVARLVTFPE